MKIIEVHYGRTYSDGNFNSTRIDVFSQLQKDEQVEDVFEELVDLVEDMRTAQLEHLKPAKRRSL